MASLRDVAERAGVSVATASRVVSGSAAVRPETRQKVERVPFDDEKSDVNAVQARGLAFFVVDRHKSIVINKHVVFLYFRMRPLVDRDGERNFALAVERLKFREIKRPVVIAVEEEKAVI